MSLISGAFDLMGALAKVATERSALRGRDTAAVDPATGERALESDTRPLPLEAVPGGFLTDVVRTTQGRMTAVEAARIGIPEAAGLSHESLRELLDQRALPLKEAKARQDIESSEALENQRRARAGREQEFGEAASDPTFKLAVQSVDREVSDNPIAKVRYANDPDSLHQLYFERFKALKATKSGARPKPVGEGKPGAAPAAAGGAGSVPAAGAKALKVRSPSGAVREVADTPQNRKMAARPGWSTVK